MMTVRCIPLTLHSENSGQIMDNYVSENEETETVESDTVGLFHRPNARPVNVAMNWTSDKSTKEGTRGPPLLSFINISSFQDLSKTIFHKRHCC